MRNNDLDHRHNLVISEIFDVHAMESGMAVGGEGGIVGVSAGHQYTAGEVEKYPAKIDTALLFSQIQRSVSLHKYITAVLS